MLQHGTLFLQGTDSMLRAQHVPALRWAMIALRITLLPAFVAVADVAMAQSDDVPPGPAAGKPVWTLSALQDLALVSNPTLTQAAAGTDMARGIRQQVGLYPNPQAGYLRKDSDVSGTSRSAGVFLGQEIVTAGKLKKAVAAESWEVEQHNWSYSAQTMRVITDVQLRYLDVLAAQENLRLMAELVRIAERGLQVTQQLFDHKQVPKSDLLQARIQWRTVQLSEREAQARYDAAWKHLSAVVGCPLETATVVGRLDVALPELDFDTSFQRLITESPLIQAAKARAMHMQGTYQVEQANALPNANVQVVAERDQIGKFTTVSTLVSMPVPVINRNQGNIFRAAAETREATAEVQRTELALRDQLAETFWRYTTAKASAEQIHTSILPDAEESLTITITAYRAGEANFLSVLTAQRTLFESRVAYADALAEAHRAHAEIDGLLLTGALNPAELGTALQAQPGQSQRRAILQQLESGSNKNLLPAAIQASGP